MRIGGNNEEKRSQLWRLSTLISTLLILAIAAFFIWRMFWENPLVGKWEDEENKVILTLVKDGSGELRGSIGEETSAVTVSLNYVLDKTDKTIAIKVRTKDLEDAVEMLDGKYLRDEIRGEFEAYIGTFNYNLEKNLTLTEREYGQSLKFTKK